MEQSDTEASISSAPELVAEKDLKCGTQGCPSKDTIWKSSARLEEHRLVKKTGPTRIGLARSFIVLSSVFRTKSFDFGSLVLR